MADIVERLRQYGHNMNIVPFRICDEAADEIERWKAQAQQATSAIAMVRAMIGEMFGPIASIESEEATLLRGPEAKHDGEAILEALQRIRSALQPSGQARAEIIEECAKVVADHKLIRDANVAYFVAKAVRALAAQEKKDTDAQAIQT